MNEERRIELSAFFERLEVDIGGGSLELLDQALMHSSYAFEQNIEFNNERLEFLGDAVLGFVTASFLYEESPEATEGEMSRNKSRIVSRRALGKVAAELGMGDILRLGRGEELGGGAKRHSTIGSALEAVIGAIYLANGFAAAEAFIRSHILPRTEKMLERDDLSDYKSRLQEIVQKQWKVVPQYITISEEGPDHEKSFVVEVRLGDRILGRGTGLRKKSAENQAAREALKELDGEDLNRGLT